MNSDNMCNSRAIYTTNKTIIQLYLLCTIQCLINSQRVTMFDYWILILLVLLNFNG